MHHIRNTHTHTYTYIYIYIFGTSTSLETARLARRWHPDKVKEEEHDQAAGFFGPPGKPSYKQGLTITSLKYTITSTEIRVK